MTDPKLKSYVDRIENLEEERKAIGGDVKDIYTEAKGKGYNPKALRKLITMRRQKADPVLDAEVEAYKAALGMAVEMVSNGEVSLRKAAKATGVSKSSIHRALAVPAASHDPETGEVDEQAATVEEISLKDKQDSVLPASTGTEEITHSVEQGDRQSPLRDGEAPVATSTAGPAVTTHAVITHDDLAPPDFLRRVPA